MYIYITIYYIYANYSIVKERERERESKWNTKIRKHKKITAPHGFGGMNKLDKIIILDQQVDHNIGIIETTSQIYQNILFSMAFCNKGHSKWWYEYKKLKIYEV